MPRTAAATRVSGNGRRRRAVPTAGARSLIDRIAQIVSENESLRKQNVDLEKEVSRLRGELIEIGTALGQLTAAPRRRGRPPRADDGVAAAPVVEKRRRKPITDPALLEKRRQSLEKARAARREKLAAASGASA